MAFVVFVVVFVFVFALLLATTATTTHDGFGGDRINGVSFGGWLLMETSWMFDQFSFPAENDFVQSLVAEGGVQYAVGTMENHWFGYLGNDGLLDGLRDFGVTHVRIPVGYWTFDTPVTLPNGTASSSAADIHTYGLNPEGFVTGGVNALEWMLDRLEQRNISVLLDLHAPPGVGSQCQSYSGQQVSDVSKSFWQGKPEPSVTGCTSGSSYASSRDPSGATWMQVGLDIVDTMANWTAAMNRKHNGIITHFELVNEPGLGWDGVEDTIKQYTLAAAKRVHAHFPSSSAVTTTVNFIGANEAGAGDWVASMVAAGKLPTPLVDYHFYYNWNGPTSMDKLLKEVCSVTPAGSSWAQYTGNNLSVAIGEWSLASNLDDPAYTNFSDPHTRDFLKAFWANQMSLYETIPGVVGQFYWTGACTLGSEAKREVERERGRERERERHTHTHRQTDRNRERECVCVYVCLCICVCVRARVCYSHIHRGLSVFKG